MFGCFKILFHKVYDDFRLIGGGGTHGRAVSESLAVHEG